VYVNFVAVFFRGQNNIPNSTVAANRKSLCSVHQSAFPAGFKGKESSKQRENTEGKGNEEWEEKRGEGRMERGAIGYEEFGV